MSDRLLVAVLGNRNSGKSTTWTRLFGGTVKTGRHERRLYLNSAQYVDAFLINGSPEEREVEVEELLPDALPSIVLCSTQFRVGVKSTYQYFFAKGYDVMVQWLNPGHGDKGEYSDDLALVSYLLGKGATLQVRDGTVNELPRVRELREFVLGWATHRDLVFTDWPA